MKTTTTTINGFNPIRLEILIENKRDLELWWAFFNAANSKKATFLNSALGGKIIAQFSDTEIGELLPMQNGTFDILDDHLTMENKK